MAAIEANALRHKLHPDPAKVAKSARLFDESPARRAASEPLGPPLPEWGNALVLLDAAPGHSPGHRHQGQHRQRQSRLGEKREVEQSMEKHGGKEAAADCSPAGDSQAVNPQGVAPHGGEEDVPQGGERCPGQHDGGPILDCKNRYAPKRIQKPAYSPGGAAISKPRASTSPGASPGDPGERPAGAPARASIGRPQAMQNRLVFRFSLPQWEHSSMNNSPSLEGSALRPGIEYADATTSSRPQTSPGRATLLFISLYAGRGILSP